MGPWARLFPHGGIGESRLYDNDKKGVSMNRRHLLKFSILGSLALLIKACSKKSTLEPQVSGELGNETTNQAEGKALALLSEEDSTAQALGYKHDASQVKADLKVEKNGTPGSKQTCLNCAFYSKTRRSKGWWKVPVAYKWLCQS